MRTNPVLTLLELERRSGWPAGERLQRLSAAARALIERDDRVRFPPCWGERLGLPRETYRERPGVVGLVVDGQGVGCGPGRPGDPQAGPHERDETAYALPLTAHPDRVWRIDRHLPFREHDLLDLLVRAMELPGIPASCRLPEGLAFRVEAEDIGRIEGRSMHLAALLALVDGASGHAHPLLRAACSFATPSSSQPERLVEVGEAEQKLAAFRREFGNGSLAIVAEGGDLDADELPFEVVWKVATLSDLAQRLHGEGLLTAFTDRGPLDTARADLVQGRFDDLLEQRHLYREAVGLARRIEGRLDQLPWEVLVSLTRSIGNSYRLLGDLENALRIAEELLARLHERGDLVSREEHAHVINEHAAALFNAHRFEDALEQLREPLATVEHDPRSFSVDLRARILTNTARAESVMGDDAARGRVLRALRLQEDAGARDRDRTANHCIEVHLRLGDLERAEELWQREIARREHDPRRLGNMFLRAYRAEIARRRGDRWELRELDEWILRRGGRRIGSWTDVVAAYYLQATARQPGRDRADVRRRLGVAIEELRRCAGVDASVFGFMATLLTLRLEAEMGEAGLSTNSLEQALHHPAAKGAVRAWYGASLDAFAKDPSVVTAEALLERVPALFGGPARPAAPV